MNKFKIGDKVRLRDNLEVGRDYGEITFLRDMKDLQGKELTIDSISRQGNYILKEGRFYYSEEMLEKIDDTDDLLEFALGKLNMTKEELRREYENSKTEKQIVEDVIKRCEDFESYCSSRGCGDCDIEKFIKRNNMKDTGTRRCMLIYEYLFEKEGE